MGNNGPDCPTMPPKSFEPCMLTVSTSCKYQVACQSGKLNFEFTCGPGGWNITPGKTCDYPHDSCAGTDLYCNNEWILPQGTNPPAPCPSMLPPVGQTCVAGGFGGTWEKCGYPCDGKDPNTGWLVATCSGTINMPGIWTHVGTCDG